ncbi:MAG: J domain-containing protein [Hyphomicrobiaceae bacterium]
MKLDSKYFDSIRIAPKEEARKERQPAAPCCQWAGCTQTGEFRAPQGRGREGSFFLFCLDHVKAYNSSYNYFQGMSDDEVAAFQKDAITGHRPTWTVGANSWAHGRSAPGGEKAPPRGFRPRVAQSDPFAFFNEHATGADNRGSEPKRQLGNMARKSLRALNLEDGASKNEVKARFKDLVKRHHPDLNGGDRGSEDRLREIIQAYNYLKQAGLC